METEGYDNFNQTANKRETGLTGLFGLCIYTYSQHKNSFVWNYCSTFVAEMKQVNHPNSVLLLGGSIGFVGSGIHSLNSQIKSKSFRNEFENRTCRGTHY